MKFKDTTLLPFSDEQITAQGFLRVDAKFARAGIQEYQAWEFGDLFRGENIPPIVRVYRPADEVFSAEAIASFQDAPVTRDHPYEEVTASNWDKYAVGHQTGEIKRDGDHLRTGLTVTKAGAINDIQRGVRELSAGYTADVERESGTTPEGEAYDAIMKNIRGNHIAIVDAARCGPTCKVGNDAAPKSVTDCAGACSCKIQNKAPQEDSQMTLVKKMIDGLTIETTQAGAEAIDKLTAQVAAAVRAKDEAVAEAQGAATVAKAEATTAASEAAGKIAVLEAEVAKLKAAQLDEAAIEAKAADRATLIGQARKVMGDAYDPAGKSAADIRRDVVVSRLKDAAATMDESMINGAFKAIEASLGDAKPLQPAAIKDGAPSGYTQPAAFSAYAGSFAADHPSQRKAN